MKPATGKTFLLATIFLAISLAAGTMYANDPLAAVSTAASAQAADSNAKSRTIQWSDLAPQDGKPFSDPFAKLTSDQLDDLSYVMRVRRLIADEKISADGEDAKEAAELAGKLQQQGVDIRWLMVQRGRVQQIRGLQVESAAKAIGESLRDQKVTLTGYVIPCKFDEGRLMEFFLVPTTAACSHEDAPPRLQVVFISTKQAIAPPNRRTPVRVTGKVVAETKARSTFNANGRVMVHSAYAMLSPEIEVSQATKKSRPPTKP